MEHETHFSLYSGGFNDSSGHNQALYDAFSDTFNFFNENFNDVSLYYNLLNDVNFSPDSEPLPLNSNVNDIQHFEPLNDIPDYDILTFDDIPHSFNYQYNLAVGDCFDDWLSVDAFMHQYCLERGFGYQIFRSDKDPKDPTIIRRKSF